MKNLPQKLPKVKDAVILNTKRNTPEGPQRLKSHHYLNNIIAKRELGDGGNEGILLTSGGHIAEAIVSNVFWAKRGCIYTPSVNTGILNGITRQFIILLLRKQGLKIKEGFFTEDELLAADEIFLTNSIQEVVSIKTLNNHTINKFSLADKLRDQYKHLINSKLMSRNELYRG